MTSSHRRNIGAGKELYSNPTTRFVAEFIGDSDFIPCQLLAARIGQADVLLGGDLLVADVPLHGEASECASVELMLRPERP